MSVVLRCGAFGDRRSTWMRAIICYHRHFCTGNARFAELAQAYEPKVIERVPPKDEFFKPPLIADKEKFNIILPPPNVTGTLHLGHALTAAIQDVLVKWNRMKGAETSWIPGLDHAGIATQVIVEKKLWSEKRKTRREIGRDEFVQEVWRWKEEKSDAIGKQLKRLGVSLDWEKEAFTMDERQSRAVIEAFVRLHESGLVYEADRLVNWSCDLQSAISDIEVDHLEISGPTNVTVPGYKKPVRFGTLTSFAYRLKDSDEEIVVATTRPETILGDVAVAVHPEDPRYSSYVGRHVVHPFSKASIPVVADTFVDRDFGTGAVKITPAHDHNDFAVAKAQGLPIVQVIDENGRVCFAGDFDGLPRFEARDAVIIGLNAAGLFRGVQDHAMKVPICSRSKDVVELLLKPQWFVDCKEMAVQCLDAVRIGDLVIEPEQFERVWFEWLENIRDWCISRQLWWGHRIPIYNCTNGTDTCKVVASNASEAKDKAHEILKSDVIEVTQVDDVLDTWFSSALLPFSASGWPDKDISSNYPLSLMETGNDILFFWVARMVMLGTKLTGQLPFNKVLLHGIICDSSGRKMSKSLGNVVAPEDVIEGKTLKDLEWQTRGAVTSGLLSEEECKKAVVGQRKMFPDGIPECGVDALRFTLLSHNIKGHTINFEVQECRTNRMFGNKVWQATKFTVKWCEEIAKVGDGGGGGETSGSDWVFDPMDGWILSRMACMVEQVDAGIRDHDFHLATAALKNFLYYELCDVYLVSPSIFILF
ncbi:PREDICTED: valine--tRNA ligase-like, partial [Nicrophorus vespilloides]|uniref:valine--tRNA ligase n=1 Tax=Nicrophorus vespilloides TaxID=110193 RepID=A0ABM1MJQ7_NICVS